MHTDTQTPTWMTEEHQLYAESVRRFLASEYIPHVARWNDQGYVDPCLLYTSPSPRDRTRSRMPSSA